MPGIVDLAFRIVRRIVHDPAVGIAVRALDLDDVGTPVAQHDGGGGCGDERTDIQYAQSCQRQARLGHCRSLQGLSSDMGAGLWRPSRPAVSVVSARGVPWELMGGSIVARKRKPNFLVVLIDDLRFDELGICGHPYMKTPHIDRIGHEGAMFTA